MSTENSRRQMKMSSRLEALGILHQDAKVFAAIINKWAIESGEEWTVKRLKGLKTEFITTVLAPDSVKQIVPWVARDEAGIPKGIIGRFWKDPYYKSKPHVVLNAFQIYTCFIASQATKTQLEKFIGSATEQPVEIPVETMMSLKNAPLWGKLNCNLIAFPPVQMYWERYRSPVKRAPAIAGTAREDLVEHDLRFAAESEPIREMYDIDWEAMNIAFPYQILNNFREKSEMHPFVGTISYLQEPGFKLRAVANPNRIVQQALEPLKEYLSYFLEMLPEDCTFNQEKGVEWCKTQFKLKKTLFSIDLSDATNLFPSEIQEMVLDKVEEFLDKGHERDAFSEWKDIFMRAAKSLWRLPGGDSLRFSKGQPLGLGPSFFLFSLSHHVVLSSLGGGGQYVILGDDIVINNSRLAKRYRKFMEDIGCKISESKSIASRHVAEFASRLIQPTRVLRQWKWREITRSNVIDICRNMGSGIVSQIPKSMIPVIAALAPIPIEIGGLGWNPKGIPLAARLETDVATHLLSSLKEDWGIIRDWKSCAVSDFVRAHVRAQESIPDDADFLPSTTDWELPYAWATGISGDSWSEVVFDRFLKRIEKLDRPGPILGETALWPRGESLPQGYITWGPAHNPWKTDTAGLYRVVARILKGDRSANK
nr:MAG: RNA dependent RNA polymerase [Mitoviridae sp.]